MAGRHDMKLEVTAEIKALIERKIASQDAARDIREKWEAARAKEKSADKALAEAALRAVGIPVGSVVTYEKAHGHHNKTREMRMKVESAEVRASDGVLEVTRLNGVTVKKNGELGVNRCRLGGMWGEIEGIKSVELPA